LAESVIVACEMIEDEVRLALRSLPPEERPPIVWVQSGLHDWPDKLHTALADIVARLDAGASSGQAVLVPSVRPGRGPADSRREEVRVGPVDTVLLAFGFCGRALVGLRSERLRLVFPRVDDCVSLLLNAGCSREEVPRNPRHYYLTRGWFTHESSLTQAFEDWVRRYGSEKAAKLRKTLFSGYEQVSVIDTGAYRLSECLEHSCKFASEVGLRCDVVQGSVQLLEKLFRQEEDSEIVVVPPGEEITFEHLIRVPEQAR